MKYVILEANGTCPNDALVRLEKKVNLLVNRKLPEDVPNGLDKMAYSFSLDESLRYEQVKDSRYSSESEEGEFYLCDIRPLTGWRPLGGHQLTNNSTGIRWYASQTMVNEND